jgi:hypothetical protein
MAKASQLKLPRIRLGGRPWRLPAGSQYPDELLVWPDEPGHYAWAPAKDMTLEDYKAALFLAGKGFVKAWTT